jgi:hypothetical protein
MSVALSGTEYFVEKIKGLMTLDLSRKGIKDISEIYGLEALTSLQSLNLSRNKISEIKGLDTLVNLEELDLSYNIITEIRGLSNLTKLRKLNLKENRFVTIAGFENLINIAKIKFGFGHWDAKSMDSIDWMSRGRPKKTLLLHGKELTELEKNIIKGDPKKIVAYCRIKVKQAGYTKRLVPAGKKIEKLEKEIAKMIKKTEKKVKEAMRRLEMAKKQKIRYDTRQMTRM